MISGQCFWTQGSSHIMRSGRGETTETAAATCHEHSEFSCFGKLSGAVLQFSCPLKND